MILPDAVSTPRLTLRRPTVGDAPAVFAHYTADPEVTRYLVWRPHRDQAETADYLAGCAAAWDGGAGGRTYLIDITGHPGGAARPAAGAFHLRFDPGPFALTFGYVLGRADWGRGVMTEALRAVLHWADRQPGIARVWSVCDIDNPASARVMEKTGLGFEGVLRRWSLHPNLDPDRPRDCRCYARVR